MKFKTDLEVKPEVLEAVKEKTAEGWISCAVARELAEELGVAPVVVGKACDLLNIRIKSCELGCFN